MEFTLAENTDIKISHGFKCLEIEIEDSYGTLQEDLLKQIFQESGAKYLDRVITEDMFFELLSENESMLHDYLQKSGYIYNKA